MNIDDFQDFPELPKDKKDPRFNLMRSEQIADTLAGAIRAESRYENGVTVKQLVGGIELFILRVNKSFGRTGDEDSWEYLRDQLMDMLVKHEHLMPTERKKSA